MSEPVQSLTQVTSNLPEWLYFLASPIDPWIGIKIPLLSFVLSIVMIGLFIIALYHVFKPWQQIRQQLKDSDQYLASKLSQESGPLTDDLKNELDEYFKNKPDLEYSWGEFSETILKIDNRFYNSLQAESFFNLSIIHKKIPTWHSAVPGILTGLGLFGTFVALLLGLAELDYNEVTKTVDNIGLFINALSGKFVSSITGLFLAILFTAIEKIWVSKLEVHLYHLQHSINKFFDRITPEKLLSFSVSELKAQRAATEVLASDLGERIQASVQQSISPEIGRMILAIEGLNQTAQTLKDLNLESLNKTLDAFERQSQCLDRIPEDMGGVVSRQLNENLNPRFDEAIAVTRNMQEALEGMKNQNADALMEVFRSTMDEYRQNLTGAASNELNELTRSLTDAASFLQSMDEKNRHMEDRMAQILNQLSQGLANQQNQFGDHAQALASSMENLISKMEHSSNQSAEAFQSRIEEMLSKNAGWSNQLQDQMQTMAHSMTQASQQMIEKLQEASSSQSNQLHEQMQAMAQSMTQASQQMIDRVQESSSSQSHQLRETHQVLNAQQNEMIQALQNEVSTMVQSIGQNILEREEQIQQLFNQTVSSQKQIIEQLSGASNQMHSAFEGYKTTLATNQNILNEAKPIVGQLQTVSGQIGSGLDGLTESNRAMQRTLSDSHQFVNDYQGLLSELKTL